MTSGEQVDSASVAGRQWLTSTPVSAADKIICAVALLLFVFATICFFFGSAFGALLNSDAAVPVLLADEMLRKGSLLPSTWYYANGEVWILSPQILALPFVAMLGVSPLALKLGNISAIALMVGSLTLPIQRVTRSWLFALTVALGVLAVFSRHQVNMVYEQVAYGWICAKLALLIFFSLRALAEPIEHSTPWQRLSTWSCISYFLLLTEFTAGSPFRAVVYWGAPLTIACIVHPSCWPRARGYYLIGLTLVALLVGALAHAILNRVLLVVPGAGALQPVATWPQHVHTIWVGLPLLLQYDPAWGITVPNPISAATLMRCFFLFAAVAASILVWSPRSSGSAEGQFLSRLAALMLAIVVVALIVSDLMSNPVTLRYLVPQILICLAAFMATVWCRLAGDRKARSVIAALFVLAFGGGGALLAATFPASNIGADCDAPAGICKLRAALTQHDLRRGYATYWNANLTTLAADGDIRVCGFALKPRAIAVRWLISHDCLEPPKDSDLYFIALARSQTTSSDRQILSEDAGNPDSVVDGGDYEIWIYEPGEHHVDWLRR